MRIIIMCMRETVAEQIKMLIFDCPCRENCCFYFIVKREDIYQKTAGLKNKDRMEQLGQNQPI